MTHERALSRYCIVILHCDVKRAYTWATEYFIISICGPGYKSKIQFSENDHAKSYFVET